MSPSDNEQTLSMAEELIRKNREDLDNVLVVDHVFKSYGHGKNKKEVLKDLNFIVKRGEVFGFIGKNGIGKSTTIDSIVGLKEFDAGNIYINGKDIKEFPLEVKDEIGYVPSEPVAYEMMSGNEYLQFIASSYGMRDESFKNNYEFLVRKFDMSDEDLNRKIKEYSHGMKQKVCLMASLIHNPRLWIMDEPTVGLDVMVYNTLVKMIREFANNGRTVFITSHNIDMVSQVCDRVAIINKGQVVKLFDLNEDPIKRRDLGKIFFRTYERDEEDEKGIK